MKPAKVWRSMPQRYRFDAAKCSSCGKVFYPPRIICDGCRGKKFESCQLRDSGKIVTYTIQHIAGSQFSDQTPFAVGIIETDDGVRLMAQIVDMPLDKIKTGLPVRLVFRKVQEDGESGVIAYAHKAAPPV
jgi:uncharacterized protein